MLHDKANLLKVILLSLILLSSLSFSIPLAHSAGSTIGQLTKSKLAWPGWDGNNSDSFIAAIDAVDPSASIKIKRGAKYTRTRSVTLNLLAADAGGSGVDKMRVRNGGDTWTNWEIYKTTKSWALPAGQGNKRVYFQVKDKAGNSSAVVSDTILYDSIAPKAYIRGPWISTNRSKTTTWEVRWFGVDKAPSSGIKNYTVKYRADNQTSWTLWKVNTTKKRANFTGKAGRSYTFKVKTKDNAYNGSAWSNKKTTIVPYDQGSLGVYLFGQRFFNYSNTNSNYYKGTVTYTTKNDGWIAYRFKGKSFHLIARKGPNRSRAMLFFDDDPNPRVIDTYSATTKYRKSVFNKTWSKPGRHYVLIINMATPGRPRLDIDGIGVGR